MSITCTDGTSYSFTYQNQRLSYVSKYKNNILVCNPTQINWDPKTNYVSTLTSYVTGLLVIDLVFVPGMAPLAFTIKVPFSKL